MSRNIGGTIDEAALARLHFGLADQLQQRQVVHRLAATGKDDAAIAALTGLGKDDVRRILGERN
jgi:hypothetical protein